MTSPLSQAGAVAEQSKWAPLHTNRFFTGLWTQRNPLRDAAVPYLYEKFYAGSRFDSLIGGQNIELTAKLTMARRAGHSIYNSQTFTNLDRFHEFRTFSGSDEVIRVMADCIGNVYDATGPDRKTNVWTKSAGGGRTSFQSVGNTLYMGNGVDQKKWVQSPKSWVLGTVFNSFDFLVDSNNNLQVATGVRSASITNVQQVAATNTCTITFKTRVALAFYVGMNVSLFGLTTATWLNGQTVTITGVTYNQITFAFVHADSSSADTGTAVTGNQWTVAKITRPGTTAAVVTLQGIGAGQCPFVMGQSVTLAGIPVNVTNWNGVQVVTVVNADGSFDFASPGPTDESQFIGTATPVTAQPNPPVWGTTIGAITQDGNQQWLCKGSSVQNWGIVAPATAPTAVNSPKPSAYHDWAADTLYSTSLSIIDSNGNVQQLVGGGQTGAIAPVWNVTTGGTTVDNTATWKNMGSATWTGTTSYSLNALIQVTWTYWVTIPGSGGGGYNTLMLIPLLPFFFLGSHSFEHVMKLVKALIFGAFGMFISAPQQDGGDSYPVTVTAVWQCTTPGITAATQPNWIDGQGAQVTDGSVTWTNIGASAGWTANLLVSLDQKVIDSNGNLQTISGSGKSGSTHPTWATSLGATTVDNTATWINAGPFSAANSLPWIYGYAFKNSVSGEVSSESPDSQPIILAADSLVTLQGQGSSDPQSDVVQLYRTSQNGTTLLLMDEIPNPPAGQTWIYVDGNIDQNLSTTTQAQIALSNNPPPVGIIALAYSLRRIWGADGNTVYFSAGPDTLNGNGNSCFPPANNFIFPSKVTRLWPCSIGLIVFTVSDAYIIQGTGTASDPFFPNTYLEGIGLLNYDAFTVNGSTPYMMTNANKLISLDPGAGMVEIGFPIGDQFDSLYDPSSSYVTWHEGSSGDTALFAADGSDGWFRLSPTTAPENGFVWSPRALLACQAVQSLETTPGNVDLLIGPGSTPGPILKRDRSVNTDNTATFVPFADIGSVTLAQPGQVAEIAFFTCVSRKVGKRPVLGLLLGEISGTFQNIYRTRQDPPLLPPSKTLYNDRYSTSQNQTPTFCHHFQLRIKWSAEDAANELLSYTIFGAVHNERGH